MTKYVRHSCLNSTNKLRNMLDCYTAENIFVGLVLTKPDIFLQTPVSMLPSRCNLKSDPIFRTPVDAAENASANNNNANTSRGKCRLGGIQALHLVIPPILVICCRIFVDLFLNYFLLVTILLLIRVQAGDVSPRQIIPFNPMLARW